MRHLLFKTLGILLIASVACAENLVFPGYDLKAEAGAQTYPLGGMLKGSVGYGYPLWQIPSGEEGRNWKYGYVRPSFEFQTAGIINRAIVGIDIYPVSIFGVSAGVGASERNTDTFRDFDCNEVACDHQLRYQFLQTRLILGYGSWAWVTTGKYEKFAAENASKPFYEEMSYLVGRTGFDDLRTLNTLLVYEWDSRWSAGYMGGFQSFIHSRHHNSSQFLIVNYSDFPWRGTVGLGEYRSSLQRHDYAMVFSVQWTGKKGVGLFD